MSGDNVRIFPLGDAALTVEFGNAISIELNKKAIALAHHFEQNRFPGYIESVPAYSTTTIFYDLLKVRNGFPEFPTAFEAVSHLAETVVKDLHVPHNSASRLVEIPVHFDKDSSPDLQDVAKYSGLMAEKVIEIFLSKSYRVYMIGFLPGFSYMGEVDERIAMPRKDTPRTVVPKGSVGIAGKQTGIYSLDSPGGWQIIGRTDVEMFTPDASSPSYLQPGDEVRFVVAT